MHGTVINYSEGGRERSSLAGRNSIALEKQADPLVKIATWLAQSTATRRFLGIGHHEAIEASSASVRYGDADAMISGEAKVDLRPSAEVSDRSCAIRRMRK